MINTEFYKNRNDTHHWGNTIQAVEQELLRLGAEPAIELRCGQACLFVPEDDGNLMSPIYLGLGQLGRRVWSHGSPLATPRIESLTRLCGFQIQHQNRQPIRRKKDGQVLGGIYLIEKL